MPKIDGYINYIAVNGKTYGIKAAIVEVKPITCPKCGSSFELKNGEGHCDYCGTNYTTHVYVEEK